MDSIVMKSIDDSVIILKYLQGQASCTMDAVKRLDKEISSKLEGFIIPEKIILFQDDSLNIKGYRYLPCVPSPYFIIRGMQITAETFHNNCKDQKVFCSVRLYLRVLVDYDPEKTPWAENHFPEWGCELQNFNMKIEESGTTKTGVMCRPQSGDWDDQIAFENILDFKKFKNKVLELGSMFGLKEKSTEPTES